MGTGTIIGVRVRSGSVTSGNCDKEQLLVCMGPVHGQTGRHGHTFWFEGRGGRGTLLGFLLFSGLPLFGAIVVVNKTSVVVVWLIVIAMVLIALERIY